MRKSAAAEALELEDEAADALGAAMGDFIEPEPKERVWTTDILVGASMGLVKVLGRHEAVVTYVGQNGDKEFLTFLAYQVTGDHVPAVIRRDAIILIGREVEDPVYSEEELEAMRKGRGQGPLDFLKVGG